MNDEEIQQQNTDSETASWTRAKEAVVELLKFITENPERPGLLETPDRVLRSFKELFAGYSQEAATHLAKNFQENDQVYNGIVLMQDIPFASWCEHHWLPFHGVAHVAYLADHHLVGASKLARVVDVYARRLQVQERMTDEIAKAIRDGIDPMPAGVAVIVQAHHSCMSCRGVQKHGTIMGTSVMLGTFRDDAATRAELMSMIQLGRRV